MVSHNKNNERNNETSRLTLYQYWRSSCSWRVRWALIHKNVPYNSIPINLLNNEQKSASYLAINPGGYVPALTVDGSTFGESIAMLEWIEETFPQNPLLPKPSLDRMRVRQMCQMIVSGIQPIQNLSVMRRHSSDPAEQSKWAQYWIHSGLKSLDSLVSEYAGTYCFGGDLTFADLCLIPQIYNANRYQVDVSEFPTLRRIHQNCLQLPSCIAASPENQPGAQ